jgi:hypothetical protein
MCTNNSSKPNIEQKVPQKSKKYEIEKVYFGPKIANKITHHQHKICILDIKWQHFNSTSLNNNIRKIF